VTVTVDKLGGFSGKGFLGARRCRVRGTFANAWRPPHCAGQEDGIFTQRNARSERDQKITGAFAGGVAASFTRRRRLMRSGSFHQAGHLQRAPAGGEADRGRKTAADVPQGCGFGTAKAKADGSVAIALTLGMGRRRLPRASSSLAISSRSTRRFTKALACWWGCSNLTPQRLRPPCDRGRQRPGVVQARDREGKDFQAGFDTLPGFQGELSRHPRRRPQCSPERNLDSSLPTATSVRRPGCRRPSRSTARTKSPSRASRCQQDHRENHARVGPFLGSFIPTGQTKAVKFNGILLPKSFVGGAGLFTGIPVTPADQ